MKGVCNDKKISRGEIYVADLNPYQGSEQGGIRPVVILQNDAGNYFSSTTIVRRVWDGGSWRDFERKIRMLWWLIKYKCWQSNLFWEYKILFLARWK